jgi:hypothetical protein
MSSDLFSMFAAMSPFTAATGAWKVAARMQIETVALMSRRAQAYMELPTTLATCSSSDDLLSQHSLFLQVAQRQYAASAQKVANSAPASVVSAINAAPTVRDYLVVSDGQAGAPQREMSRDGRTAAAPQKLRRSA